MKMDFWWRNSEYKFWQRHQRRHASWKPFRLPEADQWHSLRSAWSLCIFRRYHGATWSLLISTMSEGALNFSVRLPRRPKQLRGVWRYVSWVVFIITLLSHSAHRLFYRWHRTDWYQAINYYFLLFLPLDVIVKFPRPTFPSTHPLRRFNDFSLYFSPSHRVCPIDVS